MVAAATHTAAAATQQSAQHVDHAIALVLLGWPITKTVQQTKEQSLTGGGAGAVHLVALQPWDNQPGTCDL